MRSWGIEINDSQGVVGKGFLIRGWNNPWLYPPAGRQVIITHQNGSHLTKNSPKFRLRAASRGYEYLPIAFNLFLVTLNKLGSKDIKKRAIFQLKSMILKKT
jgi:hypothetical protein